MAKSGSPTKREVDLKEANEAVFYKAFRSMNPISRRRLALRILKDEELVDDLYHHFLSQRVSTWKDYIRQREQHIRSLRARGLTIKQIGKEIGMHFASAYRILQREQAVVASGKIPRKKNKGPSRRYR